MAELTQRQCQATLGRVVSHPTDPGLLTDGELSLVLATFEPAAASIWHAPTYRFEIRRAADNVRLGYVNLRVGDHEVLRRYVGHVGYGVDEPHRGHHVAERACRLVLRLAARFGLEPVWITCGPDNPASRRTLERLGGELVETVDVPPDYPMPPGAVRQKCRFRVACGRAAAPSDPGLRRTSDAGVAGPL
jgi:RimJ/RimL family protein N-acetyltransferase